MRLKKSHKALGVILVIYLAASFYRLSSSPMRWGGDTSLYTEGAQQLSQATGLIGKQNWHWGYILLVLVFTKIGASYKALGAFQIVLAALAGLALYDLGRAMASPLGGLIAAALFLFNPDISRWHFYILTDSIFMSLIALFVWSAWTYTEHPESRFYIGLFAGITLAAASERPNGWLLVPLAVSLGFLQTLKRSKKPWALLLASMILFIIGLSLFPRAQAGIQYAEPGSMLRQGIVIWGFPQSYLAMPQTPAPTSAVWTDNLRYVAAHFFSCLRLGLTRIAVEILHTRPFYSRLHNIAIAAYLIPLYILAVMGYGASKLSWVKSTILGVIATQLLIIALVCADWDGRFLLYFLSLVGLLASVSLSKYLERMGDTLWDYFKQPVKNLAS